MLLACASVNMNLMVMQHFVHFERETEKEKERMHRRCCILLQNQNGALSSPSLSCAHFLSFLIFWTPAPHAEERVERADEIVATEFSIVFLIPHYVNLNWVL